MGQIHKYLLTKLTWTGKGSLLDIGCGSGALTILCKKTYPEAEITGLDYWGKEWNYAKEPFSLLIITDIIFMIPTPA